MPFVVRADFAAGEIRWLTGPKLGSERTFSTRSDAQVFEKADDAQAAVTQCEQAAKGTT